MVRQRGQMQTTSHTLVLQALSHRAENLYVTNTTKEQHWSIDETGRIDTLGLDICKENDMLQQEISKLNAIPVQEEVLQIHSFAPPKKAEGNVRLIYENVNRLNTHLQDNEKLEKMKEIHDKHEINIAAYCEHKINFKHKRNVNGFNQLFKGGKAPIQSIAAHNVHENVGRIQQGGTSLLLFGHLTQQLDPNESGKDPIGLGRWSVVTLQGNGVQTCIICGYNPCRNNKLNSGTSYQQQRRFFVTTRRDLICPQKHFHNNLLEQLTK